MTKISAKNPARKHNEAFYYTKIKFAKRPAIEKKRKNSTEISITTTLFANINNSFPSFFSSSPPSSPSLQLPSQSSNVQESPNNFVTPRKKEKKSSSFSPLSFHKSTSPQIQFPPRTFSPLKKAPNTDIGNKIRKSKKWQTKSKFLTQTKSKTPRSFRKHGNDKNQVSSPLNFLSPIQQVPLMKNMLKKEKNISSTTWSPGNKETPIKQFIPQALATEKQERGSIFLVCAQHTYVSNAYLIAACVKYLGLQEKNIYWLDKLYSTNQKTLEKIKRLIGKDNVVTLAAPEYPWKYGENFNDHAKMLLKKVIANLKKIEKEEKPLPSRIILLDDGGRLIEAATKMEELKPHLNRIYTIEQTKSGYERIISLKETMNLPFISVATSKIKQEEAPYIAEHTVKKILERIQPLLSISLSNQSQKNINNLSKANKVKIGVIGGIGMIGKAMLEELHIKIPQVELYFYDPRALKQKNNNNEIPAPNVATKLGSAKDLIKKCSIIIGSVGKDTLQGISKEKLDKLINEDKHFFSTSSETVEFLTPMKDHLEGVINKDEYKKNPLADIKATVNGKTITFHNGGCPVTFESSKEEAVSTDKIAVTIGALLGAIYQIIASPKKDLEKNCGQGGTHQIELSEELQKNITEQWQESLVTDLGKEVKETKKKKFFPKPCVKKELRKKNKSQKSFIMEDFFRNTNPPNPLPTSFQTLLRVKWGGGF